MSQQLPDPLSRPAFTLVELMVSLVIVAILSSLTLGGLAVTRQRAKIDKTKSTIRKIHELIVPHYESYVRRRVPLNGPFTSGTDMARRRLSRIRTLSLVELPDSWADVAVSGTVTTGTFASLSGTIPSYAWTGNARSYGSYRQSLAFNLTAQYASSECLYMIMATGLREPDGMSQFRTDEIGDIDSDGAPEFHDGWGNPIMFIRWPFAYRSLIQSQNATTQPDPFDPLRVSDLVPFPAANQRDYAITPLIASAGPDGEYGIATGATAWSSFSSFTTIRLMSGTSAPGYETADATDNITNHQIYSP